MAAIAQAGRWEEWLITAFLDAEQLGREEEGAVRVIPNPPPIAQPVHGFFQSIGDGRVEGSRRRCEHLGATAHAFLVRNSHLWVMGCQPCVMDLLTNTAQDTRCDWCGADRPDKTPTTTFRFAELWIVAQLCPMHRMLIGS